MKKRLTAALVSLCLLFTLFPAAALAAEEPDGGLCAHHPVHDAACGYTAGSEGTPCAHEHGEDCYAQVTSCVHQHGPECYPAEPAGSTENAPEDPAAPAEPAASAAAVPAADAPTERTAEAAAEAAASLPSSADERRR